MHVRIGELLIVCSTVLHSVLDAILFTGRQWKNHNSRILYAWRCYSHLLDLADGRSYAMVYDSSLTPWGGTFRCRVAARSRVRILSPPAPWWSHAGVVPRCLLPRPKQSHCSPHAVCSYARSRTTLVRESIRDWTTHLRKGVKPDDTSEEGSSTAGRMRCCRPSLAGRTRPCFVILRNLAMFPCLLGERDNCNQKGIKRKGKE
jgi:hypothetical protein